MTPSRYLLIACTAAACITILLFVGAPAGRADESRSSTAKTIASTRIPQILRIEWNRGPNLPQGFQDSDGGVLGTKLITVAGFCSGGLPEDNRRKPGRYPRGFLKKGWEFDLANQRAGWQQIPDFPGEARQGLASAKVKDALYFWGGFSYTDPYCYRDGWKLSRQGDEWTWKPLPPFPWVITTPAMATVGSKIYAFGGADYNAKGFFTATDRAKNIERLGARLLVIDTEHLDRGWKELPVCPGTPRWVHACQAVGSKLFVIGGATGDTTIDGKPYGYCTVVDNWSLDTSTHKWSRLADLPVSSGNFPKSSSLVYKDRYVILPGGHQYTYVLNPDGTARDKYGKASSASPKSGLHNDVFVYDTQKDLFGRADALPIDNNLPMSVIVGNRIFLIGGETGGGIVDGEYYGHHPDLLLVGTIAEVVSPEP